MRVFGFAFRGAGNIFFLFFGGGRDWEKGIKGKRKRKRKRKRGRGNQI